MPMPKTFISLRIERHADDARTNFLVDFVVENRFMLFSNRPSSVLLFPSFISVHAVLSYSAYSIYLKKKIQGKRATKMNAEINHFYFDAHVSKRALTSLSSTEHVSGESWLKILAGG